MEELIRDASAPSISIVSHVGFSFGIAGKQWNQWSRREERTRCYSGRTAHLHTHLHGGWRIRIITVSIGRFDLVVVVVVVAVAVGFPHFPSVFPLEQLLICILICISSSRRNVPEEFGVCLCV